jgi:ribonuclease BN (tRNA processing enzyme)
VVLDLGSGTLANLQRHLDLADLDAVVLTHEHPDHWLDLPLLRNALRYVLELGDLAVFGTAGTLRLMGELTGPLEPTIRWGTVDARSTLALGDMRLRFSRTDHPVETLAVRVDRGARSLLYSADTGPAWRGDGVAGGVGTLLCEASLTVEAEGRFAHLSARQAADLAGTVGAERLVLTHLVPGVDPGGQARVAADVFAGPVAVATTGTTFAV